LLLANCEAKVGNYVSAYESYEKVSNLEPTIPELWLNWSALYFEQSDYKEAIKIIQSGLDVMPNEPELWYRAVAYLIHDGKFKEAYTHLETALLLDYDAHTEIFHFFPNLETQKALFRIIEQYKPSK
jgi:tetratricopeptide (TPR) repeat protein